MEALKTYTQEKTLAERVNDILAEIKMTKQELAMQLNISRSAVSQYLNGKYSSNPEAIEARLRDFVSSYDRGDDVVERPEAFLNRDSEVVGSVKPKIENFESTDYVQIIGVCRSCQEDMALGIIVAKSGYGKTHALRKYATMPRVIYIEGNETMNCKDIIRRIEGKIGMQRSYGSIDERTEKIIEFFNINQGYLIIMDEADKLINKYTQKKIELLRNITDGAHVGLVLAGEPILESLLKTYDARFANRMDFYYKLRGLSVEEVRDYLEGYDIEDGAMEEFISRARNTQTGCFRLLDRTLNNVMAYCTVAEVLDMLKEDMLNVIIGDNYIENEDERIQAITPIVEQAIADADAEIDGYLAKRYKVPFEKTPQVINKFAKDIALYNMVSRKGVNENDREKTYLTRYNAAIAFLTKVAEGRISIGVSENNTEDAARIGFSMSNSPRLFSRGNMKGW